MDVWQDKKVLIVDDSQLIREDLADLYTEIGLKVIGTAGDGVSAVEQVEKLRPDIVSLDIIMPEMDGIECFQILVDKYPEMAILMVTALAQEPRVQTQFSSQINPELYLPKPPPKELLEEKLKVIFGSGGIPAQGEFIGEQTPSN